MKMPGSEFVIIGVYVNDYIIRHHEELSKAIKCLEKIEMKTLEKTKFFLKLQIEHFENEIFVHQLTYTKNILKKFYMDKTHH